MPKRKTQGIKIAENSNYSNATTTNNNDDDINNDNDNIRKKRKRKVDSTNTNFIPSGECLPNQCHCTLPNEYLHCYCCPRKSDVKGEGERRCKWNCDRQCYLNHVLSIVHSQPAYRVTPARGPVNEREVELALVEDYMIHSRLSKDLKAKQVRLREALRRVAYKLNMVDILATLNTKTTPFRTFGKALWDGCSLEKSGNSCKMLRDKQASNYNRVLHVLSYLEENYSNQPSMTLNENQLNRLVQSIHISKKNQKECEMALTAGDGIYIHRSLVPHDVCMHLLSKVNAYTNSKNGTKLTETCALGSSGVYYDTNWYENGLLSSIQKKIFSLCQLDGGNGKGVLPATNDKAVLLIYTENAENWTHQDDNSEFKYQALMMLSEPGVDFNGGEFHILSKSGGTASNGNNKRKWIKKSIAFMNRGDVVLFRSNGHYFHGMNVVTKGTNDACHRVAVGLLHKQRV
jgi:hypothetical protein